MRVFADKFSADRGVDALAPTYALAMKLASFWLATIVLAFSSAELAVLTLSRFCGPWTLDVSNLLALETARLANASLHRLFLHLQPLLFQFLPPRFCKL